MQYSIITIVTVLCMTSPGLIYLINGSSYFLTTFIHFSHPPTHSCNLLFSGIRTWEYSSSLQKCGRNYGIGNFPLNNHHGNKQFRQKCCKKLGVKVGQGNSIFTSIIPQKILINYQEKKRKFVVEKPLQCQLTRKQPTKHGPKQHRVPSQGQQHHIPLGVVTAKGAQFSSICEDTSDKP